MQYVRTDDGWGVVTSRELSRLQQVEIETPIGTVTVLNPIEEPQGRPDEARSDDPNDAPVHEDRSDSARWMDAALDELEADCARLDAEFNEADHPRGEDGKFGSGGGEKRSPEAIRRVMSSLERLANHPSTPKGEAEAARTRLAAMRKAHPRFTTYEPLDEPDKPIASEVQPWTEAPGGGMRNRAGYVHDPANDPRPYPNAMYSGPSSAFEKAGREKNAAWQAFQKTPTPANQAAFKAAYSNYLNLQEEDDRRRQTGAPPRKDARADAAEFNEEDHPRAEDGKFGSGGGSTSHAVKIIKSGNAAGAATVNAVIESVPARHAELMGKTEIEIQPQRPGSGAGSCFREFDHKGNFTHNRVQVAESIQIKGQWVQLKPNQIKHVALHEFGHAIDWANSTRNLKDSPSKRLPQQAIDQDAAALSEQDRFRAKYWLNSKSEMWAECYALLHGEQGFGMRADEARSKFRNTLAAVKAELDNL
jgi:hypothetical protein